MEPPQFKTLRPSRAYLFLEQTEEQRELLATGIAPVAISLLRFFAFLVLCRLVYELTMFGGLALSVPLTLLRQCGIAILAIFTITLAIAVAFTLILFFERSTSGLLNDRNLLSMFGSLAGFLTTVVWFDSLPILVGPYPSTTLSVVIVLAAITLARRASLAQLKVGVYDSRPLAIRDMFALMTWASIICVFATSISPLLPIQTFFVALLIYTILQGILCTIENRLSCRHGPTVAE